MAGAEVVYLKYGLTCSYLFPLPIPLTLFRSSALLNGRAAMMRLDKASPIPGTFLSCSFVAVLISSFSEVTATADEAFGGEIRATGGAGGDRPTTTLGSEGVRDGEGEAIARSGWGVLEAAPVL